MAVAVSPPAKVLVTGANGYLAVWVVSTLLEHGYSVRGTVRTKSKGDYLKDLLKKEGERFEYVIVEDITKEGAFDEAVKDVQGVLHTASPLAMDIKHPDELIVPAVHGTLTVLNSVLKFGSEVRRVVVTSSCASILEPHDWDYLYSEADWNEFSIKETKEKVEKALPIEQYRASKTLAEKGAWDFVEQHKGEVKFELTTILPPYLFGPLLQETPTKDSLNFSVEILYEAATKQKPDDQLYNYAGNWVDVRDVALAHVLSLQKDGAAGERLIICEGAYAWQDLYDQLHAMPNPIPDIPRGKPSSERGPFKKYNNEKAIKALGIKYRSLGESAYDTIVSVRERLKPAPVPTGEGPAMMTLDEVQPGD